MRVCTTPSRKCAFVVYLAVVALQATTTFAVTIQTVPVGNPGNAADPLTGFGAVSDVYRIGKYSVINSQYADFLNAKDATGTNSLELFDSRMDTFGGINFNAANADGSKYSIVSGRGNHPVNYVSWYSAARFANWLNNGQGSSDTETGAYTLLGGTPTPTNGESVTRNLGALWFLPSEDELYKAAYYNPTASSYFLFPTASDTEPTASAPTAAPNSANYASVVGGPTDVGAYTSSASPYGTFDQGGNIAQWNETLIPGTPTGLRGVRAGAFNSFFSFSLEATSRGSGSSGAGFATIGLRVATIPEPSTAVLVVLGIISLAIAGWRRKR